MNDELPGQAQGGLATASESSVSAHEPPAVPPPSPTPRSRSARPLIFGAAAIALIVILVVAYVAVGYVDGQARLDKAQTAYNSVVDHQNALNDAVQGLVDKLPTGNLTAVTTPQLQQAKATIDQIVDKAKAAQPLIMSDDVSLSAAQSQLHQDQWLTTMNRSQLDKADAKIGHMRAALAKAKIITADYALIGPFLDAYIDLLVDAETLGSKSSASDFSGAAAADEQLKADVAKAIKLDTAPGLPASMDTLLKLIQSFANDFSSLVNASANGDEAAYNAADAAAQSDSTKLQNFDYKGLVDSIANYYQALTDAYSAEIDQANRG